MPDGQAHLERVLARSIEDILSSYRSCGNINHLDGVSLPSRSEVARLLEDLVSVVFPGYFVDDDLDELTCRYFVGERVARVLRGLERAIERALRVEASLRPTGAAEAHALAIALIESISQIRAVLDQDIQSALSGDPAAKSVPEVIMSYPGVDAIAVHRIAHRLYELGVPIIPRMMSEIVHSRTGIDIHPGATIGAHFFIDHGTGVVIGETCVIGERVKVYQGVTLGALSIKPSASLESQAKRHPTIEDDVTVYAGATILGGETVIGRGATIGGNVWLTCSVPPGTTVVLDNPMLRFIPPAPNASRERDA